MVRLYQGPDHLLQVASTGLTEHYRRFYYRDIRALIIRQTDSGKVWNAIWGTLTVLSILPATAGGATAWVMGIIAGLFAGCLLLNLALGSTVACHLCTAVQTERLPTLHRLRTARKFLRRLRPLIEAAQGPQPERSVPPDPEPPSAEANPISPEEQSTPSSGPASGETRPA